jgi:hypothetical protein
LFTAAPDYAAMSSHRITHIAGLALSIAVLAAPSALASNTPQNLVSPDAQDAAAGRGTFSAPEVTVVKVPAVATDDGGGGIRWTDAGIGAGGMLGIIALAGGTAALVTHRPRRRSTAAQPTAR